MHLWLIIGTPNSETYFGDTPLFINVVSSDKVA